MSQQEHWSLELEAAYVTAKARDEDWLMTFGVDRLFRAGTPGLPWMVKEHLERENPVIDDWKRLAAALEWRAIALGRVALALFGLWLFTLALLLGEWMG